MDSKVLRPITTFSINLNSRKGCRICQSLVHAEEKEEACCWTLLECVLDSFKLHEGADILGTHRATVHVSKALFVPH
jgi:hypothetical protein